MLCYLFIFLGTTFVSAPTVVFDSSPTGSCVCVDKGGLCPESGGCVLQIRAVVLGGNEIRTANALTSLDSDWKRKSRSATIIREPTIVRNENEIRAVRLSVIYSRPGFPEQDGRRRSNENTLLHTLNNYTRAHLEAAGSTYTVGLANAQVSGSR